MTYCVWLLLLWAFWALPVDSGWTAVTVSNVASYYFVSAAWKDYLIAVAVGDSGSAGCILRTTDSGSSWVAASSPSTFPRLSDVAYLLSGGTAYFVAVGFDTTTGYATSFTSTDGGDTWTEGTRVSSVGCRWYGVSLGSSGAGYAVGYKTVSASAALYTTTSLSTSPLTWSEMTFAGGSAIQLNDVATTDGVNVIAVGRDRVNSVGVVLYSTDSGATWTKSTAVGSSIAQFFSVDMFASTAFVVASGIVAVTTDYGLSFAHTDTAVTNGVISTSVAPAVHAVSAFSATEVYLASTTGYILQGTYTTGVGIVWSTITTVTGVVFYSMSMSPVNTNGFAGIGKNVASGATSNTIYMLFAAPTARPTALPTAKPTSVPTATPTLAGTIFNGEWSMLSNPGSSVSASRSFTGSCWPSLTKIILVGSSGDDGVVMTSSDQGSTWSGTVKPALAYATAFTDVACNSAYAVAVTGEGYVYYSSDSGSSWTVVGSGTLLGGGDSLNSVIIASDSTVYIAASSGAVYKAAAGTWSFSTCSDASVITSALYGVHSFDGSLVVVVGADGAIYYSSDTVTPTWTAASSVASNTNDLYSISCGSAYSCFAGGDSGTLLQTTDGAVTWTLIAGVTGISTVTTSSLKYHTVAMIDSKIAFVAASNGAVVSTLNAGASWTVETSLASGNTVTTLSLYRSNAVVLADTDGRAYLRLMAKPTGQPSGQPSQQPTRQPTRRPTAQPTRQPSSQPSGEPSAEPSFGMKPSGQPTRQPSVQPTVQPTGHPTRPNQYPTPGPTGQPTRQPTRQPSGMPTNPTGQPTRRPTGQPSREPSSRPTMVPSTSVQIEMKFTVTQQIENVSPFDFFENALSQMAFRAAIAQILGSKIKADYIAIDQTYGRPTAEPTPMPTPQPSSLPTKQPTAEPTAWPTFSPTAAVAHEIIAGSVTRGRQLFSGHWQQFLPRFFRNSDDSRHRRRLLVAMPGSKTEAEEEAEKEAEIEAAYYRERQSAIDSADEARGRRQLVVSTTLLQYSVAYNPTLTGFASPAAAYANSTTRLTDAIASGTLTTTLQHQAFLKGATALASATASTKVNVSAMVVTVLKNSLSPTQSPAPSPSPTKYYTLTLTYLEFQVVSAVCSIVGLFLLIGLGYFYRKYQASRSRFHKALKEASMSKEDRQRAQWCRRGVALIIRYLFCLFLCFKAQSEEEQEAAEIARLKRDNKTKREGCCRRCCRWLCCWYCCCKSLRCCFRQCFPECSWFAKPVQKDEDEDEDGDAGADGQWKDVEGGVASPFGGGGGGGLRGALKANTDMAAANGAGERKGGRKWGGNARVLEKDSPGSSPSAADDKKTTGGATGMFGAITSLFSSRKPSVESASAAGLDADAGRSKDDWTSLAKTVIKKPLADLADAGRTSPPPPPDDEAKSPDGNKPLRKNKLNRTASMQQQGGAESSASALPILTLSDVSRYAVRKKDGMGADGGVHAAVPSLPTPGEGGFVSFRDNLKLLEMRRLQEAKKSGQAHSGGLMGGGKGKGAAGGGYGIKAGVAAQEDSFLRDDSTQYLSGPGTKHR